MKTQCNSLAEIRSCISKIDLIMRLTEKCSVSQSPAIAEYQSLYRADLYNKALEISFTRGMAFSYSQLNKHHLL
jgi:hypothetical protein